MRWHLRLLLMCTVAAIAVSCSDSDKPSRDSVLDPNFALRSTTECGGSISDRVWYDTNCNGLQDSGEPRAAGVTVRLFLCDGDVQVGEKITDVNGNYTFGGILPNSYYVIFTAPAGYDFSPAFVGSDRTIDSDPDANGKTPCIFLDCDKNIRTIDAGLCEDGGEPCLSSIGDFVWFDVNCDGIQGKEELGIPGVDVDLYDCEGQLLESTTTDSNGKYEFDNLEEGRYVVCIDTPEAMDLAPKGAGTNAALDSDGNSDGCTDCFSLGECEDRTDIDFGLCEKKGEFDGCTPGFWRNHLNHWGPTGYTPDMEFNDVFDCDPELVPDGATLGEVVDAPQTYGALAFHAVAALLNASHPDVDYEWDVSEVFDAVCDGDKDALSDANEAGCSLSGDNTTGGGGGPKTK